LTLEDRLWEQLLSHFPSPQQYMMQRGYIIPFPANFSKHQHYLWAKDYFDNGYVRALKKYQLPTEQNIDEFINYVSHAHSWYKHLPITDPGQPFFFYVHPTFHMKFDATTQEWKPFVKEDCWHYSDIPTDKYRKKFGMLTYTNKSDTSNTFVPDLNLNLLYIPQKIVKMGTVNLSAFLYGPDDFQGLHRSFLEFLSTPPEEEYQTDINKEILAFFFQG